MVRVRADFVLRENSAKCRNLVWKSHRTTPGTQIILQALEIPRRLEQRPRTSINDTIDCENRCTKYHFIGYIGMFMDASLFFARSKGECPSSVFGTR